VLQTRKYDHFIEPVVARRKILAVYLRKLAFAV
jgi:hypothetical protein